MYRSQTCIILTAIIVIAGCGYDDRREAEKTRAELEAMRAELHAQKAQINNYLEELERLRGLREKGTLTEAEYAAKKKSVMLSDFASPKTAPAAVVGMTMDDLAKQFRAIESLYQNSTITNTDRDGRKKMLCDTPIVASDLKKDLETVQALYQASIITNTERDILKKRILELPVTKK